MMETDDYKRYNNQKIKNMPFIPVIVFQPQASSKLLMKVTIALLANLIIAFISTVTYLLFFSPTEEGAIFRESQMGGAAAVYNLAFYLTIVSIFSVILYILIKKRLLNLLTIIQALLLGFIGAVASSFFLPLWLITFLIILDSFNLMPYIPEDLFVNIFISVQFIIFFLFFIVIFISLISERYTGLRNNLLILLSAWIGALIGLTIGKWTPLIFMLGFALYDIFAVFKGPLKKITEELENIIDREEKEEMKRRGESSLILGLGDLFFYSLALSYSIAYLGAITSIIVASVLLVGALYTINLVLKMDRPRALPALPIPITLALVVMLLSILF